MWVALEFASESVVKEQRLFRKKGKGFRPEKLAFPT